MKKLLYLINFELSRILKGAIVVIMLLFSAEFISFMVTVNNEDNAYLRFEELLEMSGCETVFYISFIAVSGLIAYSFYKNWIGSKSIYTLLCLPLSRINIFISKLMAAILAVWLLAAAQLANIFLSYVMYLFYLPQIPKLQNGLLLAFIRWDFLKLFYPAEVIQALTSLTIIFLVAAAVIFIVAAQRAAKYYFLVFMVISGLLILILPFGAIMKLLLMAAYTIILCYKTVALVKAGDLA